MPEIYWTVKENAQGLLAPGSIARFLYLYVVLSPSHSDPPISLETIDYWVDFAGKNFWPTETFAVGGIEQENYFLRLPLPFDPHLIREIERAHPGHTDLIFTATFNIKWREVSSFHVQSHGQPEKSHTVRSLSETQNQQRSLTIVLNRDRWIEILRAIGWENFEIFEVPTQGLQSVPSLQKGLELIRQAETAFHRHEWPDVVGKVRRACVTSAAELAPNRDAATGFKLLFEKALPDEEDEPKRTMLQELTKSLTHLRAEVEHPKGMQLGRRDAELALTVAISIFRYLGSALARE